MDQQLRAVGSSQAKSERQIYLAAVKISESGERDAFLRQACQGRPEIRARIEQLIAARQANRPNPLQLAVGCSGGLPDDETSPTMTEATPHTARDTATSMIVISQHPMIGRYKLLEEVGQGGMGTVFMAQQTEPVQRKVAVKIINPGMNSREVLARFEVERQALALMDHPNIASVFDGGTTDSGLPYFVMELIRGVPLTDFCREKKLPLKERLRLIVDACSAVQHAHQKGIIHRDLKPSNIMVTLHDDRPVVKVIDFGVAKALHQDLTDKTLFTKYSSMIGTPLYMSPEQSQLSGLDVDTRSDIYSLGVVLYELLTGTTPFDKDTLSSVGIDEFRKLLSTVEPPRPSTRASELESSGRAFTDDARQDQVISITSELDWIVMKALEKDRERRYETANGLARDVQRYLDGQPVEACPPTVGYRLASFARQHRGLLTTAALLSASLFLGSAASFWYATKANLAAEKLQLEKTRAEDNLQFAIEALDEVYRQTITNERSLAGSDSQAAEPPLSVGERHLIETGLVFYERLAQLNGEDASIREKVGAAYSQIGWLRNRLGEYQAASRAFEKAVQCYQELAADYPESQDYARTFAASTASLAWQSSSATDSVERRNALFKQSVDAWSHYLNRYPNDAKAWGARSSLYWMLGNVKPALADKERALELEPDNPERYAEICRLLRNDELSATKVLKYAEEAVRLDPDNAEYRVELAKILKQKKRSMAQLQKALELDPSCAAAHHWLSRQYLRQRDFEQALVHADQAVEINPRDPNGHYFRAQVYGGLRDHTKAMKDLDRALELGPSEGYIRCYRADILCRLQRFEEAEKEYTTAIHDRPASSRFYKHRAKLRFKFSRFNEVLVDLGEAVRRNPGDVSAVTWISPTSVAKCPSADFRSGMKALADQVVELNRGSADSRMARADLLNALGDFTAAKADIEAALARNPDRASINDRLAWLLANCPRASLRDPHRAMELAAAAVSLNPEEASYWNTLGVAQYRADEYSSAVESLMKSTERRAGGDAGDFFFLAMAHWQLGNKDEARQWYDRSLKWISDHSSTDKELIRFQDEAEATMGMGPTVEEGPDRKRTVETRD